MKKPFFFSVLYLFLIVSSVSAGNFFTMGEELFMQNKPQEATALLEKAILEEPENAKVYEYLGICYQQTGKQDEAIQVMKRGLTVSLTDKKVLYFNIGNSFFLMDKNSFAEEMYSEAIKEDSAYAAPYLNRALSRIKLKKYEDAVSDYTLYLSLDPSTAQRGKILQQVEILKGVAYDEQRKKEEAEKKRLEDEARQKALLSEVLNSQKQL